ncbi:uncharacterized protein LOC116174637 [Photinus pyralis]|uniref:uncharacterized protein LOC116174637 n=1 Tax=Photinus pyralis TaxID=7054 RepID=UPI00126771E1|nr:uncharacterized protein LOC116174637 [Photinus pyralis]
MTDDYPYASRVKGRSASICATGSSSMEAIHAAIPPSGTPDTGTPVGRRRRPATRSQSARISGGKSVRRRVAVASFGNNAEIKSHCNSEPKLADQPGVTPDMSPNIRRKGSARRGASVYHRKSTAFLDVPDTRGVGCVSPGQEEEDEDSYRLRSFSFTSKGIVNRGDSFRRRRSRSNSLCPPATIGTPSPVMDGPDHIQADVTKYTVALLGAQGVGKTALISQFMTSECINAYDRPKGTKRQIEFRSNGVIEENASLKGVKLNIRFRSELKASEFCWISNCFGQL